MLLHPVLIITFCRCDGSVIPAPSPWKGQRTPNINGEERFLRGGSDGDQLKKEQDTLQQHTHGASDPGHTHGYNDKYTGGPEIVYASGPRTGWRIRRDYDANHPSTTNKAYSKIKVTNVKDARTSGETRPKNIHVVYIMKVF